MSPSINLNVAAKVSKAVAPLKSLAQTAEDLSDKVSKADRSTAELGRTQVKTAAQTQIAKEQMESLTRDIDELSRAQLEAIATSGGLATANNSLAQSIDETNLSIGRLGANIGPVSIALRNIGTQIPLLITSLGTFATALLGVATAAGVAATGLGGLLTGGFIQMSNQLQENMAGIEDSGEAIQQIGSAIRDMFGEALGPLVNQKNMELTRQFLEGSAEMVNEIAAGLQQMMNMGGGVGIVPMLQQISQTMQSELPSILDAVATNFAELQSVLVGISEAFITNVAPAISFATDILNTVASSSAAFFAEIGDLSAELIQLGSAISTGVLPVATTFIRQFTSLVEAFNQINDEAIAATAQIIAFAGAFKVLTGLFSTIAGGIQTVAGAMIAVGTASGGLTGSLAALTGGLSRTIASLVPGILEIGVATVDVVDQMGRLPPRLDDIFTRIRAGMEVSDRVNNFSDLIDEAIAGNLSELENFDFDEELDFFRMGQNLAGDFRKGLESKWDAVKSAISNLTANAAEGASDGVDIAGALPSPDQVEANKFKERMQNIGGPDFQTGEAAANQFRERMQNIDGPNFTVGEDAASEFQERMQNIDGSSLQIGEAASNQFRERMQNIDSPDFGWTDDASTSINTLTESIHGSSQELDVFSKKNSELSTDIAGVSESVRELTGDVQGIPDAFTEGFPSPDDATDVDFRERLGPSKGLPSGDAVDKSTRKSVTGMVDDVAMTTLAFDTLGETADETSTDMSFFGKFSKRAKSFRKSLTRATKSTGSFLGSLTGVSKHLSQINGAMNATIGPTRSLNQALVGQIARQSTLVGILQAYVASMYKAVGAIWAKISSLTIQNIQLAIQKKGLWGAIKALAVYTATVLKSAAALTYATVAAIALNTATGGLLIAVGALVTALAALLGGVVAMGGPMEAKESIVGKLTQALGRLGMAITKSLMPIFNSLVDTFVGIKGIISGLIIPFVRLGKSFGLISDGAGNSMSAMDALIGVVKAIIKPFEILWGIIGSVFRVVGGAFRATMGMITALLQIIIEVTGAVLGMIPFFGLLVKGANMVKNAFLAIPNALGQAFDLVKGGIEGIINLAVSGVNMLIRAANKLPKVDVETVDKVDFSGAQTVSGEKAEEAFQSDEDEDQKDIATDTNFNADLDLNQNTEVSGTFNMAPEEEERVKRLVEDAVEDANKFRRRREGQ